MVDLFSRSDHVCVVIIYETCSSHVLPNTSFKFVANFEAVGLPIKFNNYFK